MGRVIVVTAFLLSALIPALGVKPAYACSCAYPDPERVVEFADVIVIGTVDEVEIPPEIGYSMAPVYVSVAVERYLKGSGDDELEFSTAHSGASCGALEVLDVGERHVLLLKGDASNYTTSLCSGNAPLNGVSLGGVDGETYLGEIEAITGQGIAPEGWTESLSDPETDAGFIAPWLLLIAGVAGVLAIVRGGALAVRQRRLR